MKKSWLALLLLSTLPATAAASGTYQVTSCSNGTNNGVWNFSTHNNMVASGVGCPPANQSPTALATNGNSTGLTLRTPVLSGQTLPRGSFARATAFAPAGTVLLALDARFWSISRNAWLTGIWIDDTEGVASGPGIWYCDGTQLNGCGSFIVSATPSHFNLQGASQVSLTLACVSTLGSCSVSGASGLTSAQGRFNLYGSVLTVLDHVSPTLSVSGALTRGEVWQEGTVSGKLSARDNTGVRSLRLSVNGQVLARQDNNCDFSRMQPCGLDSTANLELDTRKLADGKYTAQAEAVDATGNEGYPNLVFQTFALWVDNTPPSPPAALRVTREGKFAQVGWDLPSDSGSALTGARYKLGAAPVSSEDGLPAASLTGARVPLNSRTQKMWVWLSDAAGHADVDRAAQVQLPDWSSRGEEQKLDPNRPLATPTFSRPSDRQARVCLLWSDSQPHDGLRLQFQVRSSRGGRWRKLAGSRLLGGCATVRLPRGYRRHGVLKVTLAENPQVRGFRSSYRY